jgi:putative Mg2+ transporter-C (MgtC) family protein
MRFMQRPPICYRFAMGDYPEIALRLTVALAIGALIGLERSYHGRPAGFRTHALVCLASSALMLVSVYEEHWFTARQLERLTLDPTRMGQGIMTGIGFLGAGVIMKHSFSVRGLTTAASIWITAAIGILIGVGLYFAAAVSALLAFGTLSVFRWLESRLPAQYYARLLVQFERQQKMSEAQIGKLLAEHGFTISSMSYQLNNAGRSFEYHMDVMTYQRSSASRLAETLNRSGLVTAFRISPPGD